MSDFSLVVDPASFQSNEGWRLPFDVMCGTMVVSRRSAISALMKTCRTLYTEGHKYLLRDGVHLERPIDISRFADFMLTEDPSRFAHLRKLVLNIQFLDNPSYQARLIDLLTHPCLALDTLILHHADVFLGRRAPSAIRDAFCGLRTIKRLVVLRVQEESARTIQSLRSSLESISISVDTGGVPHPFDISPTLKPFSDTLHTVLFNPQVEFSLPVHSLFEDAQPCDFPHVRTFGIVCPWDDSVLEFLASPTFAQAFPAITDLQLIPIDHPAVGHGSLSTRLRVPVGPEAQTSRHRTGLLSSLPHLSECSGELFSVYTLGLECRLSTLRLWQPIEVDDLPTLSAVLEDTRPRRLCLTTAIDDVADVFATLSTLPTQAPPRIDLDISCLRYLQVGGVPMFSQRHLKQVRSALEPLFKQPPPAGLVELSLFVGVPDGLLSRLGHQSPMQDLEPFAAFTHWASTATPSLSLIWRLSVDVDEEQCRWPDLGQGCDDDDDDDNDYDHDYEDYDHDCEDYDHDYEDYDHDYEDYDHSDSDSLRLFCEQDGDEYNSDQCWRWVDDD